MQLIDICGEEHFLSEKPKTWYKWYCNKCYNKGKTTRRNFVCCDGYTRITIDNV